MLEYVHVCVCVRECMYICVFVCLLYNNEQLKMDMTGDNDLAEDDDALMYMIQYVVCTYICTYICIYIYTYIKIYFKCLLCTYIHKWVCIFRRFGNMRSHPRTKQKNKIYAHTYIHMYIDTHR